MSEQQRKGQNEINESLLDGMFDNKKEMSPIQHPISAGTSGDDHKSPLGNEDLMDEDSVSDDEEIKYLKAELAREKKKKHDLIRQERKNKLKAELEELRSKPKDSFRVKRVTILGDSILKNIEDIHHCTVQAFPGATISRLTHVISTEKASVSDTDFIIIHVGTEDLFVQGSSSKLNTASVLMSQYNDLISVVKSQSSAEIILSSVISRPVDFKVSEELVKEVNHDMKILCKNRKVQFVNCHKHFFLGSTLNRSLFAVGGLHLNKEGTRILHRLDKIVSSKPHFIEQVRSCHGNVPPHFVVNGVIFYNIKRNGLYIVATSKAETSPIMVIELLSRFYHIAKDFCGVVNEDSVRSNVLLITELLEELLAQGYVQLASTDKLRPFIQAEPVVVCVDRSPADDVPSRLLGIESHVAPGSAANKPVVKAGTDRETHKNELFVDVIERMVVVVNGDGTLARCEVNGSINMKNFLSGSPTLKLSLNEDLVISGSNIKGYGNQVQLDRCTFHQSVRQEDFRDTRVLQLNPPVGEFAAMTYSVSGDMAVNQPFTLLHFLGDAEGSRDMMLTLRLKSDIPSRTEAVNVRCTIPVPSSVASVSQQLETDKQSAEFKENDRQIVWKIDKFPGKTEMVAHFRLVNQGHGKVNRKDIGPLVLEFEISGYTCSGLNVRQLRIQGMEKSEMPMRWVRQITVSDSYVIRL